jgi:hypothetical protein
MSLTTAQRELLQHVYDFFRQNGDWPLKWRAELALESVLDCEGGINAVFQSLGDQYLTGGGPRDSGMRILPTLRGVAECSGGQEDIGGFLALVRYCARQVRASQEPVVTVSAHQFATDERLSEAEAKRAFELMQIEGSFWSGSSGSGITLRPLVAKLATAQTLEEFEEQKGAAIVAEYGPRVETRRMSEGAGGAFFPFGRPAAPSLPVEVTSFISEERLAALRATDQSEFDCARLIRLCEELNESWKAGSLLSVAMATRAVLDHVPPIFKARVFAEVANSYAGGGRSFRTSMDHLENSARAIANAHLHVQIRQRESLPTRTQVDFSRDLDVLLGEIVRIL